MAAFLVILSIATYPGLVYLIPPPQCHANFRWDDCGKTPTPVVYYWKPGSRCEAGIWRGCLPNMNMFKDEYECVTTCIFTVRSADANFHQINADDEFETNTIMDYDGFNSTTESDNSTKENTTQTGTESGTTVEVDAGGEDNGTTTENTESKEKSDDKSEGTTPEDTIDGNDTTSSDQADTTTNESFPPTDDSLSTPDDSASTPEDSVTTPEDSGTTPATEPEGD